MRWHIVIILFFITSLFSATTSQKIAQKSNTLKKTSSLEKRLYHKLDDIANDIFKEEKSLKRILSQVNSLEQQISKLENNSKKANMELESLTRQNMNLVQTKKDLEQKIIRIIAEEFSFYIITDRGYQDSIDSIIADEVLKKMDGIIKKNFIKLTKTYSDTNSMIARHNKKIDNIKDSLKGLRHKKNELKKLKLKQAHSIDNLKKERVRYKKRIDRLKAQKAELKKTLQRLAIIKKEEDAAAKKEREARAALAKKNNQKVSVRQVGSSYQKSRVKRYRGKKTISPLKSYTVKQKFGNYVDPIYKIKIFNEAVVLSSKIANAKVKNVLAGKVVFAKETSLLENVIIVENSKGIHTIYANLAQIAPTIKVGRKIKKGYIIGRVDRDLTFEVTQKNYHINPLELIN